MLYEVMLLESTEVQEFYTFRSEGINVPLELKEGNLMLIISVIFPVTVYLKWH